MDASSQLVDAQRRRQQHRRQAALLRSSLGRFDLDTWKDTVLKVVSVGGAAAAVAASALSPTGPGTCDHNPMERCANCVTSIPYLACGVHTLRNRKSVAGKAWGIGLLGVGITSCTFHASSGKLRPTCRRLDFWSIAASSNMMLRAVYPNLPPAVTALGMALTPFKPFAVSTACTTAMELKYLYQAYRKPHLRAAQRLHAASCLAGLGCYILEDVCPQLPLMHALWHCLSAGATATINNLIADVEDERLSASSHKGKREIWDSCSELGVAKCSQERLGSGEQFV